MSAGGVIFRYRDERNYWMASTAGVFKTVAGVVSVAAQGLGLIPDGTLLEVVCSGPSISVFVNSVLAACVTDHDLAGDTWYGLVSLAASPTASTDYFANFQVF